MHAAAASAHGLVLDPATPPNAFNPYTIEEHFFLAAYIFEDVGVIH